MPTGYTHNIKDGISFKEFIMQCAKAFGACISLRDAPSNAEIPEEFTPSPYHSEALAEAQKELDEFESLTEKEVLIETNKAYTASVERYKSLCKERIDLKEKYEDMLNKAKAWTPPTPEHQGLKDFMIQQINTSIDFDCSLDYIEKPEKLTVDQWLTQRRSAILWQVNYHKKELEKEIERVTNNTNWVKALRESLKNES